MYFSICIYIFVYIYIHIIHVILTASMWGWIIVDLLIYALIIFIFCNCILSKEPYSKKSPTFHQKSPTFKNHC